jgi:hypothetical protein
MKLNNVQITRENLSAASVLEEDRYLVCLSRKLISDGFRSASSVASLGVTEIRRRYKPSPSAIKRLNSALKQFDYNLLP